MSFDVNTMKELRNWKLLDVDTKKCGKLRPNILSLHMDKIIKALLNRNEFLLSTLGAEGNIKMICTKPAAGGTVHYILKCDPTVR